MGTEMAIKPFRRGFENGPILGPVLRALLDPKMATKMAKKLFRRGSQKGADFGTRFKGAGAHLQGRPGGMRRARGRLQRGCRKLVKGQSLERRRLLKGFRITDFDVR